MMRIETSKGQFLVDMTSPPWETAADVVELILGIHGEIAAVDPPAAELFLQALAYKQRNLWRGRDD